MKITADDIKRQKFEIGFRGYNTQEVDTFLQLLSDDYDSTMKTNEKLTKEVAELRKKVEEFRQKEEFLEKALIVAQRSAEQTHEEAKKDADKIRRDAELNSEKIIGRAEIKAMEIKDEIHELQRQKNHLISQLKTVIDGANKFIEAHPEAVIEQTVKTQKAEISRDKSEFFEPKKRYKPKSELPELEESILGSNDNSVLNDIDLDNNPDIITTTES